MTSCPLAANCTASGSPILPRATTQIFIDTSFGPGSRGPQTAATRLVPAVRGRTAAAYWCAGLTPGRQPWQSDA